MARPRKFKTPAALAKKWDEYCDYCANHKATVTEFSSKLGRFITAEVNRPITMTIAGFCKFIKLPRQDFYDTYADDERFCDIVTRIREECEVDAREKFESGQIPSSLAGLWMSKYGYSTKSDNEVKGAMPVVISGDSEVKD